MKTAKQRLLKIIDELSDHEIVTILDFAENINGKKSPSADLTRASESSLDFWNNDIDDKMWNNP